MSSRMQGLILLLIAAFLPGCGHVISKNLRAEVDPLLTFRQVFQNPDAYKGKVVVWGGEIVETGNQKDGTTLIEVFQMPLGWRDEPKETGASEGRFLVLADRYLDPYIFRRGRKITVAGEILGGKTKPLGELEYRYPLLSSKQIYVWPIYYYQPYPYYYYYDPWYPWWGYPRGGFGFYYRH